MVELLHEPFGQNMLNNWTKIFSKQFVLNYWTKLWLFWAAGINIFFGLMNIMSVKWGHPEIKSFMAYTDLISYSCFFLLAIWGYRSKNLGTGAYSVFVIFAFWLAWDFKVLFF